MLYDKLLIAGGPVTASTGTFSGLLTAQSGLTGQGSILFEPSASVAIELKQPTTGKAGLRLWSGAVPAVSGGFIESGFFEGDSSTDIALYAETGKGLRFYVNGSAVEVLTIPTTGVLTALSGLTVSGEVQMDTRIKFTAASEFDIEADTADGSDTKVLSLAGGGDDNVTRGAVIKVAGNENVSQGNGFLELYAGNVAGGLINFRTGNAVIVGSFDQDTTARNTRFLVYDIDNATLERVSVGIADSGGVGYKLLRILN